MRIFIALIVPLLFFAPLLVLGAEGGTGQINLPNPLCPPLQPNCPRSEVGGLLKTIVDWLITIATPIATGMVIIGAFQMLFAGGDPERFSTGRRTIIYTAIGYAIILIGWGIAKIIESILKP